eukprot:4389874-Pyramimonas_sp.AAC.1
MAALLLPAAPPARPAWPARPPAPTPPHVLAIYFCPLGCPSCHTTLNLLPHCSSLHSISTKMSRSSCLAHSFGVIPPSFAIVCTTPMLSNLDVTSPSSHPLM